jgi:hypothetical protein
MNNAVAAALQASRLGHRPQGGTTVAWPLSREDLPGNHDTVHATVLRREHTFDAGSEIAWIRGVGWAMDVYDLGGRDVAAWKSVDGVVAQLAAQDAPGPAEWDRAEIAAPSEPAVAAVATKLGLRADCVVNEGGSTASLPASPLMAGVVRMLNAARAAGAAPGSVAGGIGVQGFAGQGAAAMVFGKE